MSGGYSILNIIYVVVQCFVAMYLVFPFLLVTAYLIKKLLGIKSWQTSLPYVTDKQFDFALIITAHKEIKFIPPLVDSILKQKHPLFQAYVVADDCDISSLQFNDNRVTVLKPDSPLSAKIKSIDFAISRFTRKHDAVIIIDADNLIHPDFLAVMNDYFRKGFRAVQADFKPKNTDTSFAKMDAIGDMFNFFLEREMRMELGLSSAIWGAGLAVDTDLYKEVMYSSHLGGFDKKLQAHIVQRLPIIAFAKEAVLYDEKISSGQSLEKQRTRWINAQFKYMKENWSIVWLGIKRLSFNLVYFGLIIVRPPLFMIIGFAIIFTLINAFVNFTFFIAWISILASFFISFLAIIAIKGKSLRFFSSVFLLPLFMVRQMLALFKIKRANKSFLQTTHTKVIYINELLNKQ